MVSDSLVVQSTFMIVAGALRIFLESGVRLRFARIGEGDRDFGLANVCEA